MTAGPIVAATDGSEESLRAVEWAAREAELRGLPLRIVSAAALPPRMAEHQTAFGRPHGGRHRGQRPRPRPRRRHPAGHRDRPRYPGRRRRAERTAGARDHRSRIGRLDAGRRLPWHGHVHRADPRVGQPVRGRPRALPGGGRPRADDRSASAGRRRHRRPGRGVGRAHVRVRGGRAAQGQPGRGARLGLGRRRQPRHPGDGGAGRPRHRRTRGRATAGPAGRWAEQIPRRRGQLRPRLRAPRPRPGRPVGRADLVVLGRHRPDGFLPGPGAVRHAVLSHAHGPVVTVP